MKHSISYRTGSGFLVIVCLPSGSVLCWSWVFGPHEFFCTCLITIAGLCLTYVVVARVHFYSAGITLPLRLHAPTPTKKRRSISLSLSRTLSLSGTSHPSIRPSVPNIFGLQKYKIQNVSKSKRSGAPHDLPSMHYCTVPYPFQSTSYSLVTRGAQRNTTQAQRPTPTEPAERK
ncbi:hypothetical protein B0H34DRAFT_720053 [Crassisporium funariophilum]|nr:hypothetical protein B0H34DRAFT_720053 [Crassisporium funariophilum]